MAEVALWKIEDLTSVAMRAQLDGLRDFVDELRGKGIDVPACWYTHPWLVSRLAIFDQWWKGISDPADGDKWWAALFVLMGSALWKEALDHSGRHMGVGDARFDLVDVVGFEEWVEGGVKSAPDHRDFTPGDEESPDGRRSHPAATDLDE